MRIGACMPSFSLTHFLPAVLKSLSWVERIVVTNSKKPWDGIGDYPDNTEEICEQADQDNIQLVSGNWQDDSEHYQRNIAMSLLKDLDYVFLLDTDEIMLVEEQKALLEFAEANKDFSGYGVNTIPYFNDLSHRALYDEGNTPLALVRPKDVRFFTTRCIEQRWIATNVARIHHLKFLMPRSQIGWRVNSKHQDELRSFNGVKEQPKDLKLEKFLSDCGYNNLKSELNESEIVLA